MKTGRGWTWGAPKTGRFTHNPPHRPKNTAFPAQSLVYTEEFSMGRDKRGMEKRQSMAICGASALENSGAILQVHYTRPGLLCVGLFTLSVVTTFSCRHSFRWWTGRDSSPRPPGFLACWLANRAFFGPATKAWYTRLNYLPTSALNDTATNV